MKIPFSPPDITDAEVEQVVEALVPVGLLPDRKQKN